MSRHTRLIGTIATTLSLGASAHAQTPVAQRIVVTEVMPIALDKPPFPLVESFLAVNPVDPSHLVLSAMSTGADATVVYVSRSAGRTWEIVTRGSGQTFRGGDPMVAVDGRGRFFLATIAPAFSVWHSSDRGRTWNGPAAAGDSSRYDDRQWIAVPRNRGPATQLVYGVTKTRDEDAASPRDVMITTLSRDGGRSFLPPRRLAPDSGYLQAATFLLVRNDGTLILPYVVNYARLPDGRYRGRIWVRTSRDGLTYSEPRQVAEYFSYGGSGDNRRWMGLGVTPMAEDPGPVRSGTLYMVWSAPTDDRLQIMISRSRDGGLTWSAPARVNGGGTSSNHSSPMIAVSPEGVIAVSWNDRRDDPSELCFRPYVAMSVDGGATFVEERVTASPTCTDSGSRWMNGGETHGLVALPDGSFRIAWSSGERSDLRLWTAVLRLN